MMSGHGANPIFFNKKNKDRPEHSLPLTPLRPITFHFYLTSPPSPLKVDVIVYLPLAVMFILLLNDKNAKTSNI